MAPTWKSEENEVRCETVRHVHVSTVTMAVVPLGVAAGSHGLLHQETEQNLNDQIAADWPGKAWPGLTLRTADI